MRYVFGATDMFSGCDFGVKYVVIDSKGPLGVGCFEGALGGYSRDAMRRHDFKTLNENEELTGEAISEIGRRITASVPRVALLNSTFLVKVAPIDSQGTKCRRQFWMMNVGTGTESQIGTAKQIIIAPHHVPGHRCCIYADISSERL